MNNPKRVFANNNDLNYIEYINNLKGEEIYKSVLNRIPENKYNLFNIKGNELTNFINHETLLNVTKSFYKYNQPYEVNDEYQAPESIKDGEKSHIEYCVLLSHIKDCDYCCKCKNITEIYKCNELKNFLYPYGHSNLKKTPIFKFPIPLRLEEEEEEEIGCHQNKYKGCCIKNINGGYNKIYAEECNPICKVDYTPVYKICKDGCRSEYRDEYRHECKPAHRHECRPACKPLCKPLCKPACKPAHRHECKPLCKKGCHNERPEKKYCQNIYPSQYQFKHYDMNCEGDCDKEKRINAYATYPQIRNNCELIKPFPCNPCKPICEPVEPLITINRCVIRKCKYDINICGGIPPSGCKCF